MAHYRIFLLVGHTKLNRNRAQSIGFYVRRQSFRRREIKDQFPLRIPYFPAGSDDRAGRGHDPVLRRLVVHQRRPSRYGRKSTVMTGNGSGTVGWILELEKWGNRLFLSHTPSPLSARCDSVKSEETIALRLGNGSSSVRYTVEGSYSQFNIVLWKQFCDNHQRSSRTCEYRIKWQRGIAGWLNWEDNEFVLKG